MFSWSLTEASLGILPRGVNQIFYLRTDLNLSSAVLIFKILGVSIDTPDTPLTRPLRYWTRCYGSARPLCWQALFCFAIWNGMRIVKSQAKNAQLILLSKPSSHQSQLFTVVVVHFVTQKSIPLGTYCIFNMSLLFLYMVLQKFIILDVIEISVLLGLRGLSHST